MKTFWVLCLALVLSAGLASAGEGWYFLAPLVKSVDDAAWERIKKELDKPKPSPEVIATWWLDLKRPLRQWEREEAFDSAQECEQWRRGLLNRARSAEQGEDLRGVQLARLRHGVCVAADDPRLKCVFPEYVVPHSGRCGP